MRAAARSARSLIGRPSDPRRFSEGRRSCDRRGSALRRGGPAARQGSEPDEGLSEPTGRTTAEVLRDGWYVTGDVARIDDDGFIFITDRLSRFSKIAGEMVPHLKIEETINAILDSSLSLSACRTTRAANGWSRSIRARTSRPRHCGTRSAAASCRSCGYRNANTSCRSTAFRLLEPERRISTRARDGHRARGRGCPVGHLR